MARKIGPTCKLCRREGKKLFLKGARCNTDKCTFEKRQAPPGPPKRFRRRPSGYAIHLREKQKAKRIYGIMERQFRHYFEIAARRKKGTGEILLQLLERRLDNIIYKLGLVSSRKTARQLVNHGHFLVNDRKVHIPSYLVKPGDSITLREKSKKLLIITESIKTDTEIPAWLSFDKTTLTAEVKDLPKREDMPADIQEDLIVELYSK
ncbi:30S ribosomal protein S4 [candidate division WOR-3 bacterium]|nr:30S ribosomal protein S4 [candidate division WOR-3 bacterium]